MKNSNILLILRTGLTIAIIGIFHGSNTLAMEVSPKIQTEITATPLEFQKSYALEPQRQAVSDYESKRFKVCYRYMGDRWHGDFLEEQHIAVNVGAPDGDYARAAEDPSVFGLQPYTTMNQVPMISAYDLAVNYNNLNMCKRIQQMKTELKKAGKTIDLKLNALHSLCVLCYNPSNNDDKAIEVHMRKLMSECSDSARACDYDYILWRH